MLKEERTLSYGPYGFTNRNLQSPGIWIFILFTLLVQDITEATIFSSTNRCYQLGPAHRNVTIAAGLFNPKISTKLLAYNASLEQCVQFACKEENISLAYLSGSECRGVTCNEDKHKELCVLSRSLEHPGHVFVRLTRGLPQHSVPAQTNKVPDESSQQDKSNGGLGNSPYERFSSLPQNVPRSSYSKLHSDYNLRDENDRINTIDKRSIDAERPPYLWKRRRKSLNSDETLSRIKEFSEDKRNAALYEVLERLKRDDLEDDESVSTDNNSEPAENRKAGIERTQRSVGPRSFDGKFGGVHSFKGERMLQRFKRLEEDTLDGSEADNRLEPNKRTIKQEPKSLSKFKSSDAKQISPHNKMYSSLKSSSSRSLSSDEALISSLIKTKENRETSLLVKRQTSFTQTDVDISASGLPLNASASSSSSSSSKPSSFSSNSAFLPKQSDKPNGGHPKRHENKPSNASDVLKRSAEPQTATQTETQVTVGAGGQSKTSSSTSSSQSSTSGQSSSTSSSSLSIPKQSDKGKGSHPKEFQNTKNNSLLKRSAEPQTTTQAQTQVTVGAGGQSKTSSSTSSSQSSTSGPASSTSSSSLSFPKQSDRDNGRHPKQHKNKENNSLMKRGAEPQTTTQAQTQVTVGAGGQSKTPSSTSSSQSSTYGAASSTSSSSLSFPKQSDKGEGSHPKPHKSKENNSAGVLKRSAEPQITTQTQTQVTVGAGGQSKTSSSTSSSQSSTSGPASSTSSSSLSFPKQSDKDKGRHPKQHKNKENNSLMKRSAEPQTTAQTQTQVTVGAGGQSQTSSSTSSSQSSTSGPASSTSSSSLSFPKQSDKDKGRHPKQHKNKEHNSLMKRSAEPQTTAQTQTQVTVGAGGQSQTSSSTSSSQSSTSGPASSTSSSNLSFPKQSDKGIGRHPKQHKSEENNSAGVRKRSAEPQTTTQTQTQVTVGAGGQSKTSSSTSSSQSSTSSQSSSTSSSSLSFPKQSDKDKGRHPKQHKNKENNSLMKRSAEPQTTAQTQTQVTVGAGGQSQTSSSTSSSQSSTSGPASSTSSSSLSFPKQSDKGIGRHPKQHKSEENNSAGVRKRSAEPQTTTQTQTQVTVGAGGQSKTSSSTSSSQSSTYGPASSTSSSSLSFPKQSDKDKGSHPKQHKNKENNSAGVLKRSAEPQITTQTQTQVTVGAGGQSKTSSSTSSSQSSTSGPASSTSSSSLSFPKQSDKDKGRHPKQHKNKENNSLMKRSAEPQTTAQTQTQVTVGAGGQSKTSSSTSSSQSSTYGPASSTSSSSLSFPKQSDKDKGRHPKQHKNKENNSLLKRSAEPQTTAQTQTQVTVGAGGQSQTSSSTSSSQSSTSGPASSTSSSSLSFPKQSDKDKGSHPKQHKSKENNSAGVLKRSAEPQTTTQTETQVTVGAGGHSKTSSSTSSSQSSTSGQSSSTSSSSLSFPKQSDKDKGSHQKQNHNQENTSPVEMKRRAEPQDSTRPEAEIQIRKGNGQQTSLSSTSTSNAPSSSSTSSQSSVNVSVPKAHLDQSKSSKNRKPSSSQSNIAVTGQDKKKDSRRLKRDPQDSTSTQAQIQITQVNGPQTSASSTSTSNAASSASSSTSSQSSVNISVPKAHSDQSKSSKNRKSDQKISTLRSQNHQRQHVTSASKKSPKKKSKERGLTKELKRSTKKSAKLVTKNKPLPVKGKIKDSRKRRRQAIYNTQGLVPHRFRMWNRYSGNGYASGVPYRPIPRSRLPLTSAVSRPSMNLQQMAGLRSQVQYAPSRGAMNLLRWNKSARVGVPQGRARVLTRQRPIVPSAVAYSPGVGIPTLQPFVTSSTRIPSQPYIQVKTAQPLIATGLPRYVGGGRLVGATPRVDGNFDANARFLGNPLVEAGRYKFLRLPTKPQMSSKNFAPTTNLVTSVLSSYFEGAGAPTQPDMDVKSVIDGKALNATLVENQEDVTKALKGCSIALGVQSGDVRDVQMTSSSEYSRNHAANRGRLGNIATGNGAAGAWCAGRDHVDKSQYLQVDLGQRSHICGVATQGIPELPIWVTSYTLEFSNDGRIWAEYTENGHTKIFQANRDEDSIVTNSLDQPITAQYIRIHPQTWNGDSICMRAELYTSRDTSRDTSHNSSLPPHEESHKSRDGIPGTGLVVYLNFDADTLDIDRRSKIAKSPGLCGDVAHMRNGSAVILDGHTIRFKPRDAITIATWIRLDDIQGMHTIFETGSNHVTRSTNHETPIGSQYHLDVKDGAVVWYHSNHNKVVFNVKTDPAIDANKWTHVTGTYDDDAHIAKVFINGHVISQAHGIGQLSQNWDDHVSVGRRENGSYLDGSIDEFRIYDKALGHSEIKDLINKCDYTKVCGGTLRTSEGVIDTPQWPAGYHGNQSCTWHIQVDASDSIVLNFNSFNLQEDGNCDKSKLVIHDGNNASAKEIGAFCGLNSPQMMGSKGPALWLHFTSTPEGEGKGFHLTYKAEANRETKKQDRPDRPVESPKCSVSTPEYNVTLVAGMKSGVFSEAPDIHDLDLCTRQCCLRKSCDLAFMISSSCYLVDCYSENLCRAKKARPSGMNPTIVFLRHRDKKDGPNEEDKPLNDEAVLFNPTSPPPKVLKCHHTEISRNVTLVGGIKAGRFLTYGHMDSMDDCIRHCCHDDKCNVAFMIQSNCYSVECKSKAGCAMKRAKPSPYRPTLAYIYRGGNKPIAEPPKKIAQADKAACKPFNVSLTLHNVTLVGGVRSGKFTDRGMVRSMEECSAYCCAEETCNVAFTIRSNCFLVACKDYESCKVKSALSDYYHPKLAYVNWSPPDEQVSADEKFAYLGCWRDSDAVAIPSLEGTDSDLTQTYRTRTKPIDSCASVSAKHDYKVFAIQKGGACMGGPKAEKTFNMFGESSDCKEGKGGALANDVYRMNSDASYTAIGCWKDSSQRALHGIEHSDPRLDDFYQSRADPVTKCAGVARERGYSVFAIQDGGECFSGPSAESDFKTFGLSRGCRGRIGGPYANSVYRLIGKFIEDTSAPPANNSETDAGEAKQNLSKPERQSAPPENTSGSAEGAPSMQEDFVTMSNGKPKRIQYTAGQIHNNVTLKYGINSGEFMDKGKMDNIHQCISACGRQPECDLAFMLGPQCFAVGCKSRLLCVTKPAFSAFYNPKIVFVTHRKIFASVESQHKCHKSETHIGVTLLGGIHAGKFDDLGQMTDMHECIRRCCDKETCDVAFMLEDECYGVSCLSNSLCRTRPARNPGKYKPQVAYVYHNGKGLDLEQATTREINERRDKTTRHSKQQGRKQGTESKLTNKHEDDRARVQSVGDDAPKMVEIADNRTDTTDGNSINNTHDSYHDDLELSRLKLLTALKMAGPLTDHDNALLANVLRHDTKLLRLQINTSRNSAASGDAISSAGIRAHILGKDRLSNGSAVVLSPLLPVTDSKFQGHTTLGNSQGDPQIVNTTIAGETNFQSMLTPIKLLYAEHESARKSDGGFHSKGSKSMPHGSPLRVLTGQQNATETEPQTSKTALLVNKQPGAKYDSNIDRILQTGKPNFTHTTNPQNLPQLGLPYTTSEHSTTGDKQGTKQTSNVKQLTGHLSHNIQPIVAVNETKPEGSASDDAQGSTPPSKVCWNGDVLFNHTLIGGINAGVFTDNGKAITMDLCMQSCCKRADCDLAFMIEDDCYSVACSSLESCRTRNARPTQFYPRIAFTTKYLGASSKATSGLAPLNSGSASYVSDASSSSGSVSESGEKPKSTKPPTVVSHKPSISVQHSCSATPIKYNVTLRMGLHSGVFTRMGKVDNMDDCIEITCNKPRSDVAFMMGHHCYSVQCYSEELCRTEPVYGTSISGLNLAPAVSFLKKNPGSDGQTLAFQDSPREHCIGSSITYNVTLRGGIKAGTFVERGHARTMRACVSECCDTTSCDLAFMFGERCYSVSCNSEKQCQAVMAKPTNLEPKISYVSKNYGMDKGISLAETDTEVNHPTCKEDSILRGLIARNKTLAGGLEAGTFKYLGKVKTMKTCMRMCCSRKSCDVAYLIDKNCFAITCFSRDLCQVTSVPTTSGDIEISAMVKTVKKETLPKHTHSVVVYVVVGAVVLAAGIGGIAWAVCMFLRRHRLKMRHKQRHDSS